MDYTRAIREQEAKAERQKEALAATEALIDGLKRLSAGGKADAPSTGQQTSKRS